MGPEEAARAARDCGAKVVVPIHWGDAAGSREDALRFAALAPSQVHLLERIA
jgi:L-ascorbate metabolism protein UlaG (beta-lactamase superfamily)